MARKIKKTKRRRMGSGVRRAALAAKSGVIYLNLPKGVKLFKEEEDTRYLLDVVPYVVKDPNTHPDSQFIEDDIWYRYPYKLHKNIGPDRKDVVCPRSIGKTCKICNDRQKLYEDPEGDEEIAKLLKPKDRTLYVVIPRKNRKYPEKPHIFDISYYNFGKRLDKELDYEEEYETFAELEGGYTLKARFVKAQFGKFTFAQCDRIDFKPRDDFEDDIPDEMPVLEDCLIILSEEEIDSIYSGIDDVSDYKDPDDEDDEDTFDEDDEDDDAEEVDADDDEEGVEITEADIKAIDEVIQDELNKQVNVMKKKELIDLIKSEELDVDLRKHKRVADLRKAVIIAVGLGEEEDDNQCPHKYVFGKDNGEYHECSDCDVYDDCLDALE